MKLFVIFLRESSTRSLQIEQDHHFNTAAPHTALRLSNQLSSLPRPRRDGLQGWDDVNSRTKSSDDRHWWCCLHHQTCSIIGPSSMHLSVFPDDSFVERFASRLLQINVPNAIATPSKRNCQHRSSKLCILVCQSLPERGWVARTGSCSNCFIRRSNWYPWSGASSHISLVNGTTPYTWRWSMVRYYFVLKLCSPWHV